MSASYLMEKVAESSPDVYEYLLKTAEEVSSSPFRDEIVGEMDSVMEKAARVVGAGGNLGGALGAAAPWGKAIGGIVATGVATDLAGDLYDAVRRGITKGRNYKKMLEANPELKDEAKENPAVKSSFETLHRFNPEFSADPYIAGQFVNQSVNIGPDLGGMKDLAQARKNIRDTRSLKTPQRVPWSSPQQRQMEKAELEKTKAEAQRARYQAAQGARDYYGPKQEAYNKGRQELSRRKQ